MAEVIEKPNTLLFFDQLGLYYIYQNLPLAILARAMNCCDPRLAGSFLGVIPPKKRQEVYILMSREKKADHESHDPTQVSKKNKSSLDALVLTANDIYHRGLLIQKGILFYGKKSEREESRCGTS